MFRKKKQTNKQTRPEVISIRDGEKTIAIRAALASRSGSEASFRELQFIADQIIAVFTDGSTANPALLFPHPAKFSERSIVYSGRGREGTKSPPYFIFFFFIIAARLPTCCGSTDKPPLSRVIIV